MTVDNINVEETGGEFDMIDATTIHDGRQYQCRRNCQNG